MGQKYHRRAASQNESEARLISKIIEKLQKKNLTGWQVRWAHKVSHQSFLALDQLECRREVVSDVAVVSIYKMKPSGTLGLSSFKVSSSSLERLDREIDQALFAADLVDNQPFELPEQPNKLSLVAIKDPQISQGILIELEERMRKAVTNQKGIRLSAAEFFVDAIESRLINHKGLDLTQEETILHSEFILLAKTGDRENEYINRYTRRFLEDFDLEGELAQSARFALDATTAGLPETGNFPVLLSGEPLDQLFNPLIARASARLKYNKMLSQELGGNVLESGASKGDKITLWSNGLIDRALGSNRFDSYGTPLHRTCLIENNILKSYLADKRYGDYLAVPVTGELGNIEVQSGSMAFDDLLNLKTSGAEKIYHLQAFSAFEPNAITGAFSAEIRAGYEISSKGIRPIKGGSVSGVLQKNLLDCWLSKERVQRERFLGPKGILFNNLTIAGE